MNIDGGYFSEPIPPARVEPSETQCNHTPMPEGYHARYEWAEQAMKTHSQIRCPRCGLWAIWLPKAEARAINAKARKVDREIIRQVKAAHKKGVPMFTEESRK